MADATPRFHLGAFLTSLTSSLCLAALLGLGIYVNVNKFIVGTESTPGYQVVDLNTGSWNIVCTVVGTAVGILAAVAFSNQDDILTRRELAHDRGVLAIFLRPLTIKRGLEQIRSFQLPVQRTILIICTIATALMGAATVALFGVHASRELIINPSSSVALAGLNETYFENARDEGLFASGIPTASSVSGQLSGFLYKAAYIAGRKIRGSYSPYEIYAAYLPEQGPLGDTTYAALNTGGGGAECVEISSVLGLHGRL
ncbi:MAG: hypothetical protein LQ346_007202 [Caloplaca aetnensis]|nr:MAG: hypothetical protein LQ346_007202 [Caloplaca aetnensis]